MKLVDTYSVKGDRIAQKPYAISHLGFCRRWGVARGERVHSWPQGWYWNFLVRVSSKINTASNDSDDRIRIDLFKLTMEQFRIKLLNISFSLLDRTSLKWFWYKISHQGCRGYNKFCWEPRHRTPGRWWQISKLRRTAAERCSREVLWPWQWSSSRLGGLKKLLCVINILSVLWKLSTNCFYFHYPYKIIC